MLGKVDTVMSELSVPSVKIASQCKLREVQGGGSGLIPLWWSRSPRILMVDRAIGTDELTFCSSNLSH